MASLTEKLNGTPVRRELGERSDYRRRRKISYPPNSVQTDGRGNIIVRPLTEGLPCFGDVVENRRGLSDRESTFGDREPQARGCAGCPLRAFCNTVVWERLKSDPALLTLHEDWERHTKPLTGDAIYAHWSYEAFVRACDALRWIDTNDDALAAKKAPRKKAAPGASGAKRRPRTVPKKVVDAIAAERDRRADELLRLRGLPRPPLWIRNRSEERSVLIADVWQARELLVEAGVNPSGRRVAEWLEENGRIPRPRPGGFASRVNEALDRVAILESEGTWEWDYPTPEKGDRPAGIHPGTVWELLEDDLDTPSNT